MYRFLALLLFLPGVLLASASQLYDDSTLEYWQSRYRDNIQWNFDNLVLSNMTPAQRRRLGQVDLQIPLRAPGKLADDPLVFYATAGRIVVPVKSVKFFDDISLALAYYQLRHGNIQTVYAYLGMLKYRDQADMPGGRFPSPLEALGVPKDIWKNDKDVDSLSQKILKSAIVWILAHETAHLLHQHPGYGPEVGSQQAQANEAEADRFANTIMRRIGIAPGGMAAYFMMMLHWSPHIADFADRAAWMHYQTTEATHPFTAERMRLLAKDLSTNSEDFTAGEEDTQLATRQVAYIADQIASIATRMEDPEVGKAIKLQGRATDPESLKASWIGQEPAKPKQPGSPFEGDYQGTMTHRLASGEEEELPLFMSLHRRGTRVSGVFRFGLGDGLLQGIVRNGRLHFEWRFADSAGQGVLNAQAGGLSGTWGYRDSGDNAGIWRLYR